MKPARIQADFNELIESDLVLLSQQDIKLDYSGQEVLLFRAKKLTFIWMIQMKMALLTI